MSSNLRVHFPVLVLAALSVPAALFADQVTLKNGDRLTGKVVTTDDKVLVLKTDYADEIKIKRSDIAGVKTDEPIFVTLKDTGKVEGKVETSADTVRVQKSDGSTVTAEPGAVLAIRDTPSERAWEREQERIHNPRLNDFWAGFVTLALANASGNSKTTTLATTASATRIAGKNKMALNFAQLYSTQSTTAPYGATANRISGAFRVDRDITHKLFVYFVNAYDYDRFLDLDLRVVVGGGLGYHVWKTDKGYFDLAGGVGWNREKFSPVTGTFVRNSAEGQFGEEWAYQPHSKLKLWERFMILPNFTELGQYRMNFDITASVPVAKWLEWNVGFSDRFLSNPVPGKKQNDTLLTMGVRATFDQTKPKM